MWTSTTRSWKTNHDATMHAQMSTSLSSTPRWGRHLPPFDVLWWTWVLLDLFSSIFWLNFAFSWITKFFLVDKTEAVSYSCCCEVKNPDCTLSQLSLKFLLISAQGTQKMRIPVTNTKLQLPDHESLIASWVKHLTSYCEVVDWISAWESTFVLIVLIWLLISIPSCA